MTSCLGLNKVSDGGDDPEAAILKACVAGQDECQCAGRCQRLGPFKVLVNPADRNPLIEAAEKAFRYAAFFKSAERHSAALHSAMAHDHVLSPGGEHLSPRSTRPFLTPHHVRRVAAAQLNDTLLSSSPAVQLTCRLVSEATHFDEAFELLAPRLTPGGDWDRVSPSTRARVDLGMLEIVERLGADPANNYPEPMLRTVNGETAESLGLAQRLEFRPGFKFKDSEGGRGGTPVLQCILMDTPASLLALRYILFRWPGLVYDSYGNGPFAGEHILHMAIVKRSHQILIFIEQHVRGGLAALQWLGNRSLHHWWEEADRARRLSAASGFVQIPRRSDDEDRPGEFFFLGSSCYFGGLPLSFAASTGSSLWVFMYLVNRLKVNVDAADGAIEFGGRRNTALHMAVIACQNESYRYLKALGAREDIPNADGYKPLELAVLLGKRCTQNKLEVPEEGGALDICAFPERAEECGPGEEESLPIPTMFAFIFKLRQRTNWVFGNVSSVEFPVDELHGPLACKGNSALMIACRAEKLDILCPVGAVSFVRMTSEQNSNVYEAADTDLDETFKFPHKPGIKPPPVESTVLLILAECVWFGFGRRLLVCEMLGVYTPWIGLLTWITVSRGTLDDWVQGNLERAEIVDGLLLLFTGALIWLQTAKVWRREFLTLDYWNPFKPALLSIGTSAVDASFIGSLTGACALTIAAVVVRYLNRRQTGWFNGYSFPPDSEILAVACILAYFYALYYLRCFQFFGTLAIIVIQMLAKDIIRIIIIYVCCLVGFAIAFHVILYADDTCAVTQCAEPFKSVQDSILATMMMTIGEYQTDIMGSGRSQWLLRPLSILYIIVANILLINLLIALLNDTFATIAERTVQKHAVDRTNVVLQLEKLSPQWLRKRFYNQFMKRVKSDTPTDEWEWDATKLDENGRKTKVYFRRVLNIERTGLPEHDDGILLAVGGTPTDDDCLSQILKASDVVAHGDRRQREKLIDLEDMRDGIAQALKEFDGYVVTDADTLVVCDLQQDHVAGGALEIADSEAAVSACNEVMAFFEKRGALIVLTQTLKDEEHRFFDSEAAKRHGEIHNTAEVSGRFRSEDMPYGRQTIWPKHCVVGTSGSQFASGLYIPDKLCWIVRKGYRKFVDCHSAFFDNDRCSRTGLEQFINRHHLPPDPKAPVPAGKPGRLFVIGLAYDHCVRYTAEEARAISRAAFARDQQPPPQDGPKGIRHTLTRRLSRGPGQFGSDDGARPRIGWGEVVVLEDCTRLLHEESFDGLHHMRDRLRASGVKVVPRGSLFAPQQPTPGHTFPPLSPSGQTPRLSANLPQQMYQPFPQPQFGQTSPPPQASPASYGLSPMPAVPAPPPPPVQNAAALQAPPPLQLPSPQQIPQAPIPGLDAAPPPRSLREQLGRPPPGVAPAPGIVSTYVNAAFDAASAAPAQGAAPAGPDPASASEVADAANGWRTNPTSQ